jgi:hypothetical protein
MTYYSIEKLSKLPSEEIETIIINSGNWDFVKNNIEKCYPQIIIDKFINHIEFNEEFILKNIAIFQDYLATILNLKKYITDDFLIAIFNKSNYSQLKMARKLKEPLRDFKKFDELFY